MDKVRTYSLRLSQLKGQEGHQVVYAVEKAIRLLEYFGFTFEDLSKAVKHHKREFHNGRFNLHEEVGV